MGEGDERTGGGREAACCMTMDDAEVVALPCDSHSGNYIGLHTDMACG